MSAHTNNLALNNEEDVTGELKAKHSQSLTFDVEMSNSSESVGNTKVYVQEHTIFVDGTELSERREMEIILDGPSEGQSILKHTRRINGQEYTVMEKRDHGQFKSTESITQMTPTEVSSFKEKWRVLWHPEMTEDEILDQKLHTLGGPEIYNEVEATPLAPQTPVINEESMNEEKPEKEKKRFWCCC